MNLFRPEFPVSSTKSACRSAAHPPWVPQQVLAIALRSGDIAATRTVCSISHVFHKSWQHNDARTSCGIASRNAGASLCIRNNLCLSAGSFPLLKTWEAPSIHSVSCRSCRPSNSNQAVCSYILWWAKLVPKMAGAFASRPCTLWWSST